MSEPEIRAYDEASDLVAVDRIWREVGWIEAGKQEALAAFMRSGNAEVATIDGDAECMVHWTPGTIDHTGSVLGLCAVTAVTTSLIGRKQGFASSMTARALRQGAEAGHAVAALGIFDQGFYDRVGFGTAAEDLLVHFDPSRLLVDHIPYRRPVRVTAAMATDIHAALVARRRPHGAVCLHGGADMIEGELGFDDTPFGIGYRDDDGTLTHFVLGDLKGEHGPFSVRYLAYRSVAELLELLRALRELGDQVYTVRMVEPADVQLQALLREPFRDRQRSIRSEHEVGARAIAWWQLRMLDVEACVAALATTGPAVEFDLTLDDPAARWLDGDGWPGVGGDYTVRFGPTSHAGRGHTGGLPVLRTTVNAFTRLWFGVRSVATLAATDPLDGPAELLDALDAALTLPTPHPGWDF